MRIEVLGPVRLSTDEGAVVEVPERQLRVLLVALVAADGEPVAADALIDRLWAGQTPANPRKVLRSKMSRLRAVLDHAAPGGRDLLRYTPAGYRLAAAAEDVDAGLFKQALDEAGRLNETRHRSQVLEGALSLWRGEPFGDAGDEIWLASAAAELTELRGDVVETLAETLLELNEPERALVHASSGHQRYPSRERLAGAVMLAMYRVGRQADALELYESVRQRLAEDLGADPGPRLRELHGRILRQDPSLAIHPVAIPAAGFRRRTNLPAETTPLIGRRAEARRLLGLMEGSRLVTLTGMGGVGKTRLALHVARELANSERSVWFIDLTELGGASQSQSAGGERIASLVLRVLDVREQSSTSRDVDRLSEACGSTPATLVLDNCEHVVGEVAGFVADILRSAPRLQVLATSREALGLPEEQRFDVSTLDTMPRDNAQPSEAAEFFTARAKASDPSFDLDARTAEVVDELCRRLDGLPLALELAAARTRGISVEDLLERLSDRLNLLRRPGRGVPRRQQTLRGMIDWSWSLLDEAQQAVLRRLAVHPGSFTLQAAEDICGADPQEPSHVADILIELVDRSMVRATSTPTGMRYGLLESVAVFAGEKLDEAGERERAAQRHLDHYVGLACEVDRRLRGPEQRRWLARLDAERPQLRNAFEEAVRTRDGAHAVLLTVATFWYHWLAGRQAHLRGDLQRAIALPGPRDDTYAAAVTFEASFSLGVTHGREAYMIAESLGSFVDHGVARARVQWFAGTSLLAVGARAAGEQHVEEAIDVLARAGEDWDVAVAVSQREWFLLGSTRETPRGMPDGRDPEAVLRDLGDGYGRAQWLAVEHRAAEARGDHQGAADAAGRALSIALDFGLWGDAADLLGATSLAALRRGDVTEALDYLGRARSLATEVAFDYALGTADFVSAMISRYQGDLPGAHAAMERWVDGGGLDATRWANTHIERGFLAVLQDDRACARHSLETARALLPVATDAPVTASILELAAAVRAEEGDAPGAAELLGSAAAHRERAGVEPSAPALQDADWIRARCAEVLSDDEVAAAVERGRAILTDDQLDVLFPPTPGP